MGDPLTIFGLFVACGAFISIVAAIISGVAFPPDPKEELYIGKGTNYILDIRTVPPEVQLVRCDRCMSVFPEERIDIDALEADSGETCPVCSKGDALRDLEKALSKANTYRPFPEGCVRCVASAPDGYKS